MAVRSLVTGEQKPLVNGAADARYVASGHLVYARMGTLLARPSTWRGSPSRAEPVGVVDDVMQDVNSGSRSAIRARLSSASPRTERWRTCREASHRNPSSQWCGSIAAAQSSRRYRRPVDGLYTHLSPDERHVLLGTEIYDLTRGARSLLLPNSPRRLVIWHPDGQRLTASTGRTESQLVWIPVDGTGAPKPLPTTEEGAPMSWSPNGKTLAYLKGSDDSTGREIWLLTLADGDAPAVTRRLVAGRVGYGRAEFSPDGRYLAYESRQSGRLEVYVQAVSEGGRRLTISSNGGSRPRGQVTDVSCSIGRREKTAPLV